MILIRQGVTDGNPLWLTEFWNRNVRRVGSLNGVAPGPGPIFSPSLVTNDGKLDDYNGDPYTLTANGVQLAAPIVAQRDGFTLYRTETPWRLLEQEQNVYADGQATNPITYTYFPRGGPGKLVVSLSRTSYNSPGPPAKATIRVGTVKLDPNGEPELDRVLIVRHALVNNRKLTKVPVPIAVTPLIVRVTVFTTYSSSPY